MIRLAALLSLLLGLTASTVLAQNKGSGSGSSSSAVEAPATGTSAPPSAATSALSDHEISDLKAGRGMGMALAAELNGYPGPSHVLELAEPLKLSDPQRKDVQTVFDWMQAQAESLGRAYLETEVALATAFRNGNITQAMLTDRLKAAEAARAELRQVHLAAHIETASLLTEPQKSLYSALRHYMKRTSSQSRGSGSGSGEGAAASCSGCCSGGGASCASPGRSSVSK